jgi:3-deoxy-D-manno-octulosonic-acid transferase
VFVGGSFVPRGGQNILEPAACGKPVLFGPHMENFADSVQVLLGRGGIQVASLEQLQRVMSDLLKREAHRRELGEIARGQVGAIRGAAARNAGLIGALLAG